MSSVYTTNEFLMIKSGSGIRKIINISSIYGLLESGKSTFLQYSAAKAAMNSLTKTLAKRVSPRVLVNAVSPGYTWTPAWSGTSNEEKKRYESRTLINRFVDPSEVAQVVVMLAENDSITGQIIVVDGG